MAIELFKLQTSCNKNTVSTQKFYALSNFDRNEWVREIKTESDTILYPKCQKCTSSHSSAELLDILDIIKTLKSRIREEIVTISHLAENNV